MKRKTFSTTDVINEVNALDELEKIRIYWDYFNKVRFATYKVGDELRFLYSTIKFPTLQQFISPSNIKVSKNYFGGGRDRIDLSGVYWWYLIRFNKLYNVE